jgi:hypothetical protein
MNTQGEAPGVSQCMGGDVQVVDAGSGTSSRVTRDSIMHPAPRGQWPAAATHTMRACWSDLAKVAIVDISWNLKFYTYKILVAIYVTFNFTHKIKNFTLHCN